MHLCCQAGSTIYIYIIYFFLGMAFTCGLVSRKGHRASIDSTVVKRMKDSGAILIAVTNIPELNLWCETRNNVYGQTQNPYDFTKTAGGSSGGEV